MFSVPIKRALSKASMMQLISKARDCNIKKVINHAPRSFGAGVLALCASLLLFFGISSVSAQTGLSPTLKDCILLRTIGLPVDCDFGPPPVLGQEVAVPMRLEDGDEFELSLPALMRQGAILFDAVWTVQEGAGRPGLKGNDAPLADPMSPLVFPFNKNRGSHPAFDRPGADDSAVGGVGFDRYTQPHCSLRTSVHFLFNDRPVTAMAGDPTLENVNGFA